jgi:hypothetical protein
MLERGRARRGPALLLTTFVKMKTVTPSISVTNPCATLWRKLNATTVLSQQHQTIFGRLITNPSLFTYATFTEQI